MVRVEDNICTYRYGEILHASAVLLKLFMSDRDYMSTGENMSGSDPMKYDPMKYN